MKRILFVNYMAGWSGPTHSLLKLLKYLPPRYVPAVLVPGQGEGADFMRQQGISVFSVEHLRAGAIPELRRLIRREKIDLVYGNNAHGAIRNAILAGKLSGRPAVWHFREMVGSRSVRDKLCYLLADAIVAVSHACAAQVPFFVPKRRIHVVHNGVDCPAAEWDRPAVRARVRKELGIPPDSTLIVELANICERKGQLHAIAALQAILPRIPNAHLILAGNLNAEHRPYIDAVRQAADAEEIAGHVHLLGFRQDVTDLIHASDLYIHTALKDPHPRAVMEAMAGELPVLAFATDGVVETVDDGRTGCLVPPGNVSVLGDTALRLLEDTDLLRAMGQAAVSRVQTHFSAQSTAAKIADVIGKVLRDD